MEEDTIFKPHPSQYLFFGVGVLVLTAAFLAFFYNVDSYRLASDSVEKSVCLAEMRSCGNYALVGAGFVGVGFILRLLDQIHDIDYRIHALLLAQAAPDRAEPLADAKTPAAPLAEPAAAAAAPEPAPQTVDNPPSDN